MRTKYAKFFMKNDLPKIYGENFLKRLIRVYSVVFFSKYGFYPKLVNWGLVGKNLKKFMEVYSEYQFASLILIHFEWHGTSGQDDFAFKRLSDNCFPFEWIFKNVNAYEAFARNTLKWEFDNPVWLMKFVDEKLYNIKS